MAESGFVQNIIQKSKDVSHNAYKTIEIEHAEVHSGNSYAANRSTTVLGASSWIQLQMTAASTSKQIHLKELIVNNSGGMAQVRIIEQTTGSTMATGTAAVTALQKNRNSTKTATAELFSDPTLVGTSSVVVTDYYVGSTGSNARGGNSGQDANSHELVLKYGTTYVIRVDNLAAAGICGVTALWYED